MSQDSIVRLAQFISVKALTGQQVLYSAAFPQGHPHLHPLYCIERVTKPLIRIQPQNIVYVVCIKCRSIPGPQRWSFMPRQ